MNYEQRIQNELNKITEEYSKQIYELKPEKGLKDTNKFKRKVIKALTNAKPQFHITYGNAKLPKTTAIINLGTWFNCPGRKEGFCEICKECYDKSPEVRFQDRIQGRFEQEVTFRTMTYKELAKEVIKQITYKNKHTRNKINLIRWAEVGELRNQQDLEKIAKASTIIYNTIRIKSYIYTHNQTLNFNIERPYLTINGSGFMVDNEYRVIDKKDIEKEFNTLNDISNKRECICECTECNYCSLKQGYILIEELRV